MFALSTSSLISADVMSRSVVLLISLSLLEQTTLSSCESADLTQRRESFLTASPQSNVFRNITARSGFKLNSQNERLEIRLGEFLEQFKRLKKNLAYRSSPEDLILSFAEIDKLDKQIKEEKEKIEIYRNHRMVLKLLESKVEALKVEAKKKLVKPLSGDIDYIIQDLEELKAGGAKDKAWILQVFLEELKGDLQQINNVNDLNIVKGKVVQVVGDFEALKTAIRDGIFVQPVGENDNRNVGMSYYIVRYPNEE